MLEALPRPDGAGEKTNAEGGPFLARPGATASKRQAETAAGQAIAWLQNRG